MRAIPLEAALSAKSKSHMAASAELETPGTPWLKTVPDERDVANATATLTHFAKLFASP